jgi:hypothetical protein
MRNAAMPIFIDEVVFRGEVVGGAASATSGDPGAGPAPATAADGPDREALVAEITQAVIDHLERALERIGER